MIEPFRRGDFVGYVFAQPGNDTTYGVVERVEGDRVHWFEPFFKVHTSTIAGSLWRPSAAELACRMAADGQSKTIGEWLKDVELTA